MSNINIKQAIMTRQKLIEQRQALAVDPAELMNNPMGALGKINEIKQAGELTKEIETLSDEVVLWAVHTINEVEALANG